MGNAAEKETTENKEIDIISEIDKKFQSRMSEQEIKIAEKIASLSSKGKDEKEGKSESELYGESEDDGDFITKKDLKKVIGSVLNEAEKKTEKILETKLNHRTEKSSRDSEAFQSFPMLNPQSPHYNREFTAAVKQELDSRVARGKSNDDPDLIYDCAAVVKATNPKWSKNIDEEVREQTRQLDNREGGFVVRKGSGESPATPNARQLELAKAWGVSEKDLKEHMKNR